MKLKFLGATETVTGSKHLVITNKGKQILLDCGLYQGAGKETDAMNRKLSVNPASIDAVILSHAHIDHSGNLPNLVKQGFTGQIYCTPATYDVCKILLLDSAHIHESDIQYINKRRVRDGREPLKPIYTVRDAERSLKQFKTVPYNAEFQLNDEISFHFTDVGHIIGSASVHLTSHEDEKKIRLSFTGDIGRYGDLLLKAPQPFQQADYIISESTYGNRLHESSEDSTARLLDIVNNTCVHKKGKLIIPAFSLGRTQEIVFVLDDLKNKKLLPDIKVFVDSPLSVSATEIVRKHSECFNESLIGYIKKDPNPFGFENLFYIRDVEDSKRLNNLEEPCIIISASGMADAGRVKHHIRNSITDPKNTILMVGYCAPHSLGSELQEGKKNVHIFGEYYEVRAEVESLHSYSAHADYQEMIRFLSCQEKSLVKQLFLVHGDADAKTYFKHLLEKEGFPQVIIPSRSEHFDLI